MKLGKRNYDLRLVFACILLGAILITAFDRELGINLFTEIAGAALTVFVINRILDRRERQRRVSIDQRILRDIQAIIASYFSIWKHILWQYSPAEKISSQKDFTAIFSLLIERTNLSERFKVVSLHHPESWDLFFNNRPIKECFENYHTTLTKQIQRFIDDFKIYIDPELLNILLNIMECQYFKEVFSINQEETRNLILLDGEEPDKLESYLRANDLAHLSHFAQLMTYSQRLKQLTNDFSDIDVELYQIKEHFRHPATRFN